MIKIRDYTNKLMSFPMLKRREIDKIVKEIYKKGKIDGSKSFKQKAPAR